MRGCTVRRFRLGWRCVQPESSIRAKRDLRHAEFRMVANRSLEELDELITRQGNRNLLPARLYTASDLTRANGSD